MTIRKPDESILNLLSSFFGVEGTILADYYSRIEKSYYSVTSNPNQGFLSVEKFSNIQFEYKKTLDNWKQASLIGVDLPLLFNSDNSNGQTVVIVGIDPLRKRKDFKNFNTANVIIGTPYAFHSTYYRESKGRTKSYYDFAKYICSKGYNIYLTDISKIWMNDFEKDDEKKRFVLKEEMSISKEILLSEIKTINPELLIAFGDSVEKTLDSLELSRKIIKLPHPSGANRSWHSIIKSKATCEEKVKYLCSEFDKRTE